MLNENIALSKAILNKVGIKPDSPEWEDYLKIRELCEKNHGYVGILTRLRFQDNVDMDEIKSIFEVLKNSKIDVGKLNKMTYSDILTIFYDEFKTTDNNTDYEVVFKDNTYTYYRANTYKGILKTGSPSWCLKTKANWDKYQAKYPQQYVVVDNRYKNRLPVPDDDVLSSYSSKKGWVRYGISVKVNEDRSVTWTACDDNNKLCEFTPSSYTFFGVFCTLLNILGGSKKSYYDDFLGCQKVDGVKSWLKITNRDKAFSWLKIKDTSYFRDESELYLLLSESYSNIPIILSLDNTQPKVVYPINTQGEVKYSSIGGKLAKLIMEEYAKKSTDNLYSGIKLKLGILSIDEIKKSEKFVMQVDNWIVFSRNKDYYIVVNSNPKDYNVPTISFGKCQYDIDEDPLFFYLGKNDLVPVSVAVRPIKVQPFHKKVIDGLKLSKEKPKTEIDNQDFKDSERPEEKKVKGFWDFLK